MKATARWLGRRGVELWIPVGLLLVWYATSRGSTDQFFPPMTTVVSRLRSDFISSGIEENLVPSLERILYGISLAVALGVTIGYVVGLTKTTRSLLLPVFDLFRSTPVIALLSVFTGVFGFGSTSEVLLITWSAFWPILLGTVAGVAAVDSGFRDTATALRMTWWHKLLLVRMPAAGPQIFTGISVGISVSVTAMVAIELLTANSGLGRYLTTSKVQFDMRSAFAGALVAGLVGFGLATLFYVLERRVFMKWHYQRGAGRGDI